MSSDKAPKHRAGKFLGVPYNWNKPTWDREKHTWWDPENDKLVVPRSYGWGYALNLAALRHQKLRGKK